MTLNDKIRNFLLEEKFEIIGIITISIILFLVGILIERYAVEHKDLATYIPFLSILSGVILFTYQLIIMLKKIIKLKNAKDWKSDKRHFLFKSIPIGISSVSFLWTDYVIAHSLHMSYFAFAFSVNIESISEAWYHLHIAEIIFPILSVFSLWCFRIK